MAEEAGKWNPIKHDRLLRELNKIEQDERCDMRMLETDRHRFRSKLKRFEVPQLSSGSDAMDVRMYDTHNPGFCYHCTGAIRACDTSPRKNLVDAFDVVYSMLFTDGEVDPDKVLCLHVLAAHCGKSGSSESSEIRPITPLLEKGKKEKFSGTWNSVLPCYVLDIQRNVANASNEIKRHKDPLAMEAEEEVLRDLERGYKRYLEENSDVGLALATNRKRSRMIPNGIGKTTIIPPHVYSMLGAAQELKIKQAIAEESRRKKFRRSDSSVKNVDDQSISFRLDDEDDVISRRLMTATSIRGPRIIGTSLGSGFQSRSRRSTTSSYKIEPSVTTLKGASPGSSGVNPLLEDVRTDMQIVTIKPSDRGMGRIASNASSTRSPFRNFSSTHGPGSPCSNSIMSGVSGSLGEPRKIVRPIFVNYPVESLDLKNKEYKAVPILVNNQIQALVHSVLDVLERVNPSKMRKIISTAKSPYEIRRMLTRPDIQSFIDFLAGQPLISSPNSFVISMASILTEIDPRVENSIEKELVATTLAVPPAPGLNRLVQEIRNNLFVDPEQTVGHKAEIKIETFDHQKQKLLDSRPPGKESNGGKDVFDVNTSCLHPDIQETKMTCACCYAKWKDSLPDTERSKAPDFSFLVSDEVEMTPENAGKYRINTSETNSNKEKKSSITSADKLFEKLMRAGVKMSGQKINADKIDEARSYSISGLTADRESSISASLQKRCSKITSGDDVPSPKCQFKPWKASQNPDFLEPDRMILRRMTNPQRILVGQMCASLKTRRINMEGLVRGRTPLAALITPVLSHEALRILTKGTRQATIKKKVMTEKKDDCVSIVSEKLTGPVLAKIRQAVAENETNRRLTSFLKNRI